MLYAAIKSKQSSTGWTGNSGKAVDGNSNSNYGGKSCTHTKANRNSWWRVDLGTTRSISTIKIQNRKCTGDCGKRLQKFEIQIGDDDFPDFDASTHRKNSESNNAKCVGTASNAAGLFYPNGVGGGQKVTIECNRPMSASVYEI